MIRNEEQVEAALKELAKTDQSHANAKALCKFLDQKRKTVKAIAYQESKAKTDKARESAAYASKEFSEICEQIKSAEYDYQLLTNTRLRAQLAVDVWRSENANRRNGSI